MKILLVLALGAGLYYAAYILPSQMLSDTTSHTTAEPGHTTSHTTGNTTTPEVRYVVIVEVLEQRSGAGEQFQNVGYLQRGESVTVYELAETESGACRKWARIGAAVWVCADMLGQ